MRVFSADFVYAERELKRDHVVLVEETGKVKQVLPRRELSEDKEETASDLHHIPGCALLPGCVDSHVHTFQVFLKGRAQRAADFDEWVRRHLYPLALAMDERSIHAAALLAFYKMLKAGTTTVGEFFYLHNRPDGKSSENANERAVIHAARRVGIRIALLRAFYDQGDLPGQARFKESPKDAARRTEELAARHAGDTCVTVLPAAHSIHGSTEAAIRAASDLAKSWNSPLHIHLAERASDVDRARARHGATPLAALDRMKVVDSRLVPVHGCWLSAAERARLGEVGGGLAYAPVTNQLLGDGVTDISDLAGRGVRVSLGTDAASVLSIFEEMRRAEGVDRVTKGRMGLAATESVFEMGTVNGGRNLGVAAGSLAPGNWADMVAIDLSDPSLAPSVVEGPEHLLDRIVRSMIPETAVKNVYVGGIPVVHDGRTLQIDEEEVLLEVRQNLPDYAGG